VLKNNYEEKYSTSSSTVFLNNINKGGGNEIYSKDTMKVSPKFLQVEEKMPAFPVEPPKKELNTVSDILNDFESKIF
jgi:hypothetical protein